LKQITEDAATTLLGAVATVVLYAGLRPVCSLCRQRQIRTGCGLLSSELQGYKDAAVGLRFSGGPVVTSYQVTTACK